MPRPNTPWRWPGRRRRWLRRRARFRGRCRRNRGRARARRASREDTLRTGLVGGDRLTPMLGDGDCLLMDEVEGDHRRDAAGSATLVVRAPNFVFEVPRLRSDPRDADADGDFLAIVELTLVRALDRR